MAEQRADQAQRTARESAAKSQETAEKAAEPLTGMVEQGAATARRAGESARQSDEELVTLSRDHIEGMANAGQAMLRSSSELGGIWMAYWNEQLAENAGAVRSLAACRSWDEAFSVQNEFARASLERLWARAARSAEITAGLVGSSLRTLP